MLALLERIFLSPLKRCNLGCISYHPVVLGLESGSRVKFAREDVWEGKDKMVEERKNFNRSQFLSLPSGKVVKVESIFMGRRGWSKDLIYYSDIITRWLYFASFSTLCINVIEVY